MPDPTRHELERRLDDLDGGDGPSVEEAYAALVAAASDTADEHDRRVLAETDDDVLRSFIGPFDDEGNE